MMRAPRRRDALSLVILCAAAFITVIACWRGHSLWPTASAAAQDNTMLERRISQLEQRFYTMETSIMRLEQQVMLAQRPSSITPPGGRDTDSALLRSEVEALRLRLGEIECGLVKLDERTLTAAVRDARRKSNASSTDPCRLSPEIPLRLSARPSD